MSNIPFSGPAELGPLPPYLRGLGENVSPGTSGSHHRPATVAAAASSRPSRPASDAPLPIPAYPPFVGLPPLPALVFLSKRVQWVAWKYIAKTGSDRLAKVPFNPATGSEAKSNNPATWSTYAKAASFAKRNNLPGVGFVLSADDDLTGIDLDDCRDPATGFLKPWAGELIAMAETYAEASPSGTGIRLFAQGKVLKATKSDPAGVEIYGEKRYLTVTGQHVEGTPDTINPAPKTQAMLLARVEAVKTEAQAAKATVLGVLAARGPTSVGVREGFFPAVNARALANLAAWVTALLPAARPSGTGYRVSSVDLRRDLEEDLSITPDGIVDFGVHDMGDTRDGKRSAVDLVVEHGAAVDVSDAKGAAMWLCERLGVTPESLGWKGTEARLDDFVAVLSEHRFLHIPSGKLWPIQSVDKTLPPVFMPAKSGEESKSLKPSLWLMLNRPVVQLAWHPGQPRMIRNRVSREGELVASPGSTVFNLYRPPEPSTGGDAAAAGPWLDHLRRLFPNAGDAEHLAAFMAHCVQRPGEKINHALVLAGPPGVGKDTLLAPLVKAVGPGNAQEIRPADLMAPFNGFMKSVVLRISEVHDLGEVSRYQYYEKSKTVIATPPDYVRINEKYQPEYYCANVCGVIMTTNRMESLHLAPDDRRHFVVQAALEPKDLPPNFFASFYAWYKGGGFDHVVAYLRAYDLSGFDAKAAPRKTPEFYQIVAAGRAPEADEMASVIERLGNPEALTLEHLRGATAIGDFVDLGEWLRDRKNRRRIGFRLSECGYTPVPADTARDCLWPVKGLRVQIYARSDLGQAERHRAAAALAQAANEPRLPILRAVK